MDVLSIGAGYVGAPTMAVMARHCPEHRFVVADIDVEKIAAWNSCNLPIYEPHLDETVHEVRDVNLFFTHKVEEAIAEADIIFISVCTPTKTQGEGEGKACDLRYVEAVARTIRDNVTKACIVVEKTTVPVGTVDMLNKIFEGCKHHIDVLNNPEFLAEGTAIADLESPDRVLIGGPDTRIPSAAYVLAGLYRHWVPADRIILTNEYSAEMSKLAANAMLSQRVSSINSLAEVCVHTGARIEEVARAIGMDSRIGDKFLKPSLGFGGSCFKKDVLNLVYIAESLGLVEVADYWNEVILMNEHQQERMVRRMLKEMFGTIAGKRIAVLGLAFKARTGDVRESPSLRLCRLLYEEGAHIHVSDPEAMQNATRELGSLVYYHSEPETAATNAHAVVIATEWEDYRYLDWQGIHDRMEKPASIFDGRNILDRVSLERIGFKYHSIGNS
jgi:UDPglucose 6-dehydrogenase